MEPMPHGALRATLAFLLFLAPAAARSHGLGVWAEPSGTDRVLVEATWSTAEPAAGADVVVLAADGAQLLTGRTGDDGRFHFSNPAAAAWPLEIRVQADDEHRGRFVLEAQGRDGAVPAARGGHRGEHHDGDRHRGDRHGAGHREH